MRVLFHYGQMELAECGWDQLKEEFWLGPMISLGDAFGSAPARRILVQVRIFFLN